MTQLEKLAYEYSTADEKYRSSYDGYIAGFKAAREDAYDIVVEHTGKFIAELRFVGEEDAND